MILKTIVGRTFLISILFVALETIASAQIAGGLDETTNTGLGGRNYIVGTVYSPEGSPITWRMRIRLTSPTAGEVIATTDDRGRFVFSRVGYGVYTLTIDREKDFQTLTQDVEITGRRSTTPETYTVTLRLRALEPAKRKNPAVVDASLAGVPKKALELYQKASKLAEQNDIRGAIDQLKLAVVQYLKFVNALNQIGVLHLRLNEPDKADDAFQAALKIKPDSYEPLVNRAVALFRLARYAEAETVLRETLKVKSESAAAYYYLGRTLNKLNRNDEAEAAYLQSVKLSPGEFKEAHRLLAVIYLNRGTHAKVIEQLEIYLKLAPSAPDAADLRKVIAQSKQALEAKRTNSKP